MSLSIGISLKLGQRRRDTPAPGPDALTYRGEPITYRGVPLTYTGEN